MFCPNCGSKNSLEQNYCRGCGLKLDAIVEAVSGQFPSKEYADLQRRRERFEWIGLLCFSLAGLLGLLMLVVLAALYKVVILGPEIIFGSAAAAMIGFLLLSLFFFNYPKFFMKARKLEPDENPPSAVVTAKLIEDRPFDPASSATEGTTEFLKVPNARRRD
jgi:zinc ribbon protein